MFSQSILDHFKSPHNAGDLLDANGVASVSNPVCGDLIKLSVRIVEGRIEAVRFQAQGCVAAIAAGSVLTDLLTGKTVVEARAITPEQISEELGGLPPATWHAAQLCCDAVVAVVGTR